MDQSAEKILEFIRFSVNPNVQIEYDINEIDWKELFLFSSNQAILGIVFDGMKQLALNRRIIPSLLLMEWLALSEQIAGRNLILNEECARLTKSLEAKGHHTAILKGQANARIYPNPSARQPGDIDIWVDGGYNSVAKLLEELGFLKVADIREFNIYKKNKTGIEKANHHIHLPKNEYGVEIEVHFKPSSGNRNPFTNKKLLYFLEMELAKGNQMTEEGFRVPSFLFSIIMQLAHIR